MFINTIWQQIQVKMPKNSKWPPNGWSKGPKIDINHKHDKYSHIIPLKKDNFTHIMFLDKYPVHLITKKHNYSI